MLGAGGMPCVLAVWSKPAAVVQEFVGNTYDKFCRAVFGARHCGLPCQYLATIGVNT